MICSPNLASRCRSRLSRRCCAPIWLTSALVELRFGHEVVGLSQDPDSVRVEVSDSAGASYTTRARWVLGCDGANGVVRDQIGARYVGRSDPRPNFNVVFRAPGLEPPLGPAVQYWVVGGPVTGLMGRLDLAGTWWAIMPGIEAGYGQAHDAELITDLIGATPCESLRYWPPIRGRPGCSSPTRSAAAGCSWSARPRM